VKRSRRKHRLKSEFVKVFGCRPNDESATNLGAGVGKPPREETAGDEVERFRVRYGDLIAADDVGDLWEDVLRGWSRWVRVISKRRPAWAGDGSRTI
jgi:hypothetical protein